ncbi:MAG: hypothetical protein HUU02_15760 [Bacteroidetes bacterium]|nr:hypothetical protein [Bacteroidota bacterium]
MQDGRNTDSGFTVPEGYRAFCTCPTYFALDLIGTNLSMNGIDAVWHYPDLFDPAVQPTEQPSLFVRQEQSERASELLASLDLIDFTDHHGI